MLNSSIIKGLVLAMIAFIFVGIALVVGAPLMVQGFDATYNAKNATQFTALQTVAGFGPALIILGFIVMVGVVAFLGIRIASNKG